MFLGWAVFNFLNPVSSSYGNRTRVSAVRGRRLNRLTNEPFIILSKGQLNVKRFFYFAYFTLFFCLKRSRFHQIPIRIIFGNMVSKFLKTFVKHRDDQFKCFCCKAAVIVVRQLISYPKHL